MVAWQLQKDLTEADLDAAGCQEQVYVEPESSPAMSIASDEDI